MGIELPCDLKMEMEGDDSYTAQWIAVHPEFRQLNYGTKLHGLRDPGHLGSLSQLLAIPGHEETAQSRRDWGE